MKIQAINQNTYFGSKKVSNNKKVAYSATYQPTESTKAQYTYYKDGTRLYKQTTPDEKMYFKQTKLLE